MSTSVEKLVIIGAGPAGLTAAIYASRAQLNPLVIEGKNPGGQLMGTTYIENWPGNKSILGPKLMMDMKDHAKHFGTRFLAEEVVKVDFSKKPFTLWSSKNKELKTEAIIIASGSIPNKLQIPGEEEYWGKGVTTCAVCDGAFYGDKKVIIVGGGDTAMEDASFMTKFTEKITIIQIEDKLTASIAMQERVINNPKIKIIYASTLSEILGDGSHVTQAVVVNKKTGVTNTVAVDGIFLAIGQKPTTQVYKDQLELSKWGYIEAVEGTKTSVPGIFVAGDVQDFRYKQAIVAAGSGCKAALDAERYLKD